MAKFVPTEYIERFIGNNLHEKTHMEIFFQFVSSMLFSGDEYSVEDFSLLNYMDLRQSVEYYITHNKITAKQTARAYLGNLKNFFDNLEKHYQIHSDVYINGDFIPEFYETTEEIISILNNTVNTETATEEQSLELFNRITEIERIYSYELAVEQIDHYINQQQDKPAMFSCILSACAARMVIEYGLSNKIIINMKLDDVDLEQAIIKRGKYTLPIPARLKISLCKYIRIREYLLAKIGSDQEWLFVECTGKKIDGQNASDKLFKKVVGENSSIAFMPYAKKCIERMMNAGLNKKIIGDITGYKGTVYDNICQFLDDSNEENIQNKITEFILPSNESKVRKIGYINCPMCGQSIRATSEELVLIKKVGDTLYLACKKCGERMGRYDE